VPTFEILARDGERLSIRSTPEIAAAASYLLADGQGVVQPAAPALAPRDVNVILRERRSELAQALESVEPEESVLGVTARRLARRLMVASSHA
jgi:RES domain-containing protein